MSIEDVYLFPLSFAQQRLWFLDQLVRKNPFYNLPTVLRLSGRLNRSALEWSLQQVIQRHEILRTVFVPVEGELSQVVLPEVPLHLIQIDLSHLEKVEREQKVLAQAREEAWNPFDLARGPLIRTRLLHLQEDEHVLILTLHHIICDGWSMDIFFRELSAYYNAFLEGAPCRLPDLPIQYADYVLWQKEHLQGDYLAQQLDYWRQELAGAPTILTLPTDYPRPAQQTFNGSDLTFELPLELLRALRELSQQEHVTLFMTLLTAFQVLLARYTGQQELLIGTPVAGRTQVETEALIGLFVNTLVLRSRFTPGQTFRELLAQTREKCLQAYTHQEVPFEQLVEVLQPERDLSRNPLFQAMFILQNTPQPAPTLRELQASFQTFDRQAANFDVMLVLTEHNAGLSGLIEYSTDLFTEETIRRLVGHYRVLLQQILTNPEESIWRIPLLPEQEYQQIIYGWNATRAPYPRDLCVHQLVEEQAAIHPNNIAVLFEEQTWTYGALNAYANQLAHFLRSRGAEPNTFVAVLLERSAEMVPALLGILKAGAAYIPLEGSFPPARLRWILAQLNVRWLITQSTWLPVIEQLGNLPALQTIICLDTDAGTSDETEEFLDHARRVEREFITSAYLKRFLPENPMPVASSRDLAYVIFTSGSTGTPKGVMVQHRPVINLIEWIRQAFHMSASDRVLFITSLCFDLSVYDIFGVLAAGGAIRVASAQDLKDPYRLVVRLYDEPITFWDSAPAALQQLVPLLAAHHPPTNVPSLRLVFLSGDWIPLTLPDQVKAAFPAARVIGLGGATEATVWSNFFPIGEINPLWKSIPYGRPIHNARYHVLNRQFQPCPIGVPGDLYIGGECLSLGYLGEPALTAEKYVPDPFSDEPGARLYATGDMARYLPDGNLEFLGRVDHQVKVRGFRIELGEIEAALSQHPALRESTVLSREDRPGDRRLVAYVVPRTGYQVTAAELRQYLKERLPDYMLPAAFMVLPALPLTSNAKVDRKALPAPDWTQHHEADGQEIVYTPIEEILAGIWAEALSVEHIRPEDSFFDLGGHSLLATQVIAHIRASFQVELPLRSLFEAPTLAGLAEQIARVRLAAKADMTEQRQEVPLVPGSRTAPLPLSFAQQRLWFLDQLEPHSAAYTIPVAVRLCGPLNRELLEDSLQLLVQRHETLRTIFVAHQGMPQVRIDPEARLPLSVVDLSSTKQGLSPDVVRQYIDTEALRPFDLSTGPLLRATLLICSFEEHILLVTMHHSISDGWSLQIFFRELSSVYTALSKQQVPHLPTMPVQYVDFAVWQRTMFQGRLLERQLDYWRKQLADLPPLLNVPTDAPRQASQSSRGASLHSDLSPELSQRLKALCRQEDVTLFMLLLAVFALLLARLSGQDNIVVGTPIAGRTRVEVEHLIGFFINTLALRIDLSGNPTFRDLLTQVRQVALDAYTHQDLPFEQLVEHLQLERSMSHTPLFQVMFNLLNFGNIQLDFPEIDVEFLPLPEPVSKFDFTLYAQERSDAIRLYLAYNADLFTAQRMQMMLEHYQLLLEQVLEEPEKPLSSLSLQTPGSVHTLPSPSVPLYADWSRTALQAFLEQVERVSTRVALVGEQGTWSYNELDECSNRLAHALMRSGINAGDIVAIYGARSPSLVASLLGIWKAGAAFLILDPAYPAPRLEACLRQARPSGFLCLSTHLEPPQSLLDCLQVLKPRCFMTLTGESPAQWGTLLAELPATSPGIAIMLDDLAYLAFTSGTTGTPRGILTTHRPLGHFLHWHCETFSLNEDDTFSLLSGLAFDPLLRDIFTPLWLGATLCIPGSQEFVEPQRLLDWLHMCAVSVVHLTPALSQFLLEGYAKQDALADPENAQDTGVLLPALRYLFLGGERLTWQLVRLLRLRLSATATYVNLYGATETPQAMSYFVVPAQEEFDGVACGEIPLGRGIADVQLLLLTPERSLAGIGELAEIYVRTPYLAIGYLSDEQATSDRFLVNPFTGEHTDRLYKTGDLGRYLPNGLVIFAGRADFQVKIRGFRVEPGEVEAILCIHEAVQDCVVLAREDAPDMPCLVGYLQLRQPVETRDILDFLRQRLPAYMLPTALVVLPAFPLTPNGKVDRRALPAPARITNDASPLSLPRDAIEAALAEIWCTFLQLLEVGVHDNFFLLGGHSLLATQIVSRIRETFRVELPLRWLFEAPTIASLAERLRRLSGTEQKVPEVPLRAYKRGYQVELSFAQQRLWFLDQLEQLESASYTLSIAIRLQGVLHVQALAESLDVIVRRHETLRTTFQIYEGEPRQVIAPEGQIALQRIPLAHLAREQQEEQAQRLAVCEARTIFQLARGPLLRAMLLELGDEEHVLVLTMHHIISDGWSLQIFVAELTACYRALCRGEQPLLPTLPVQYADYALWQRSWLQGEVLEAQLRYWRHCLRGAPEVLNLPTDHPRPPMQNFAGAHYTFTWSRELLTELKSFSQRQGVTLFMTLLTGFLIVLARYSLQDDLVVGTPIANRTRAEVEHLIGFFVNMLALRVSLAGDPDFAELLARVREVALEAYAHQDLPFEQLVEELRPTRNLRHSPLFQVLFALHNTPTAELDLGDLSLQVLDVENGTSKFDLSLFMIECPEGLRATVEYSTALFERPTIVRMMQHLHMLLTAALANPQCPISALPLMDAQEQEGVLAAWNRDRQGFEHDLCIHALFERQAARTPTALAVSSAAGQLTYAELEEQANQLAHYLRAQGVGVETLVGICIERSPALLIGMLGILKAGGAYVPLDPAYPQERLALMREDAGLAIILTQHSLVKPFTRQDTKVICLESAWSEIMGHPRTPPENFCEVQNLAYMIYTSGSTGHPKGVQITHRSVVNFLQAMRETPGITEQDRLLAVTTLSFDIAVLEFFLPLISGAQVLLASREEASDGMRLATLLHESGATLMQATPATWRLLLDAGWQGNPNLTILCGGEALPLELARRLLDKCATLWNMYGPTETTIWSTLAQVHATQDQVTLGGPIANTRIYVLDRRLQLVPPGVAGELYIGGQGLARGYWLLPAQTAERFVPDPFCPEPGARMYRTGDLVRFLPSGQLHYLGRLDQQVKVRGFRIESGEIEATLARHPAVRQAAIAVHELRPGDARLIAYLVPRLDMLSADNVADASASQLEQWQTIYDHAYRQAPAPDDATFHIAGWNSSYTGLPIPEHEMREWVERTVERLSTLQPRRVLELGCGTGLLLYRLAPHCQHYHGLDFTQSAIENIRQQLAIHPLPQVTLARKRADELDDLPLPTFDLVILNSVVQYFPGITYLLQVLERAARVVEPGGRIFLGDVRSLPLLQAFQTSVQLHSAPAHLPLAQLRQRVQQQIAQEEELLIDPTFFSALLAHLPGLARVEILVKRGAIQNEMTCFRYDVLLHFGPVPPSFETDERINCSQRQLELAEVRALLERRPASLALEHIIDARTEHALHAASLLHSLDAELDVDTLCTHLAQYQVRGCDPEALWNLADELGYLLNLQWPVDGSVGRYNAYFLRAGAQASAAPVPFSQEHIPVSQTWQRYANNPLQGSYIRQVVPQVRSFLREQLPEYMHPSAYVLLDELPLTPNGKLDRRALPAPDAPDAAAQRSYVPPQTPLEKQLAEIWEAVLGRERIGLYDNFFDLGGHSLLTTQIVSRVRTVLGVTLSLRTFFETPTIAGQASAITALHLEQEDTQTMEALLSELEHLSEEEARALFEAHTSVEVEPHE